MTITLPPELEAQLLEAAQLQGKDITTLVIEILIQVLAKDSQFLSPQPAKFMRFAGIAARDTALLDALEQDVIRDRASDLQRQFDL